MSDFKRHSPELRELYDKKIDEAFLIYTEKPLPESLFEELAHRIRIRLEHVRIIGDDSGEFGAVIPEDGIGWPLLVSVERGGTDPFGVTITIGFDRSVEPSAVA